MGHRSPAIGYLVAAAVTVGTLAFGASGVAGATAPALTATSGTPAASTQLTPGAQRRLSHFSCSRAPKALGRLQKVEARIAAGLPKLHAAETKATAAGKTKRANRIQKAITRLERPGTTARLQALAAAIEAKCNVSAPITPPTSAAPGAPGT